MTHLQRLIDTLTRSFTHFTHRALLSTKAAAGEEPSGLMSALGIKMYPDLTDANQREVGVVQLTGRVRH